MSVSESEDALAIEQMSFAHPYSNPNCSNSPLICFPKFSLSITTQSFTFIPSSFRIDEDERLLDMSERDMRGDRGDLSKIPF